MDAFPPLDTGQWCSISEKKQMRRKNKMQYENYKSLKGKYAYRVVALLLLWYKYALITSISLLSALRRMVLEAKFLKSLKIEHFLIMNRPIPMAYPFSFIQFYHFYACKSILLLLLSTTCTQSSFKHKPTCTS